MRNTILTLVAFTAAALSFTGCATTSNLASVQQEFNSLDRATAIRCAPVEYAQTEVYLHQADEEFAEEGFLDMVHGRRYLEAAREKLAETKKKIDECLRMPGAAPSAMAPAAAAPAPSPGAPAAPSAVAPTPSPGEPTPSAAAPTPYAAAPGAPPAAVAPLPPQAQAMTREAPEGAHQLRVHFDFDRSHIRSDAARILESAIAFVKENNGKVSIRIEGHTCSIGTNEYNMGLSDRRAQSAKQYLMEKTGVSADNIETVGYGEEKPAQSNETDEGRQYNRRAEITISPR